MVFWGFLLSWSCVALEASILLLRAIDHMECFGCGWSIFLMCERTTDKQLEWARSELEWAPVGVVRACYFELVL